MAPLRRAIWLGAVVSVLVLSLAGSTGSSHAPSTSESTRIRTFAVAGDHDAVAAVRPLADRSPLDLRSLHSSLLLLAWVGLMVTALVARTAGRALQERCLRAGRVVWTRRALDRGPPAASFA